MTLLVRTRSWLAGGAGEAAEPRLSTGWLALAALLSIALWLLAEQLVRLAPHPQKPILLAAANTALAAQQAIARAKAERGLLQNASVDHNRTGLIGPEWSEITTTMGDLPAKRTVTNPDLAAAIARLLLAQRQEKGTRVGLALSGSFVGANVAAIAAVEALGLRPVIVTSLGASMFGATDPDFTWLDMEAVVARAGVWTARTAVVVLGAESGLGGGLSDTGRTMLREAARRNGYQPLQAADFATLKGQVHAVLEGAPGGLGAFISTGGSVLAMGTCVDAHRLPNGLVRGRLPCHDGVPGLVQDFAGRGTPVLHILNVRRLAVDWGLPFDPVPLPAIGDNARIYGRLAFP